MRILFSIALLLAASPAPAQDLVAKADARSPEEERKAFKLPPGFAAQLVAAEPAIQKPMQLAFDRRGRLWATTSHHYPFAVEEGKGTDKLFVLSDFDTAGLAKTVTVFDEHLNIPIGVLPLGDGASVIVSEAGRILKLTDSDGDGKADLREVLYSGFGIRDTHGMTNSFTRRGDGWVYACHGYLNSSTVKGKDGHEIHMESGHTFRFRPDGSRIEIFTRGQVNPFGMCVDPWLNVYTADCHSRPMTQLIRGARYDHFGQPPDGLGHAPHVINHMHGSTGLCGISYYAADYYPKEWNGVMFVGNVVTSRINCDRIEWHGSTPVGKELPDFLVSSDPWFRPVDLKLGPDGAMYISDFYNRIIGHYEVDLRHPARDKDRGRIWRIVRSEAPPLKRTAPRPLDKDHAAIFTVTSVGDLDDELRKILLTALHFNPSVRVQRAAVDGMTAHPHAQFIEPLLEYMSTIAADDTHMRMAARIALRNCIVGAGGVGKVSALATGVKAVALYDVAIAIRSKDSSEFLAKNIGLENLTPVQRAAAAAVIGQFDPALAGTVLKADGESHDVVNALLGGLQAAGLKKLPDALPPVIDTLVTASLNGKTPEWSRAAATLKLATSFSESVAAFENSKCTQVALAQLSNSQAPVNVRANLAESLVPIPSPAIQHALRRILADPEEALFLRTRLVGSLLAKPGVTDRVAAKTMLKTAPYALAVAIATGLAGDATGAEILLSCVKSGEAPARLLQERAVINRLNGAKIAGLDAKLADLTRSLPTPEKRLDELITARAAGFHKAKADATLGKEIYVKNCAICHQLNNEGAKIGPHLDGVGIRGLERILEDTIDPNRNVDVAFRATKLDLKDGRSLTGLLLREEGAVYVLADALGKEQRIPQADVEDKTTLVQTAMPANLDTIIPEADYYNLIAYLLEQKPKK